MQCNAITEAIWNDNVGEIDMINTNTNRWQSVRLLFDKRITGGNLKSNYRWQQSAVAEGRGGGGGQPLQKEEAAGAIVAHFFPVGRST